MKQILTLLLLFSFQVFSQSKLDSLLFQKVNEYRVSKSLQKFEWDSTCFKAADIHTKYLFRTKKVGHSEDTLTEIIDRYKLFDKVGFWQTTAEVAQGGFKNIYIHSGRSDSLVVKSNLPHCNSDSLDYLLAEIILEEWKKSKLHNQIILDPELTRLGAKCIAVVQYKTELKNIHTYTVFSTMVLVGGVYLNDSVRKKIVKTTKKPFN